MRGERFRIGKEVRHAFGMGGSLALVVALLAATGPFVGLLDSGGTFFLQGYVERPSDGFFGGFSFRWQLDGERLVPMIINDTVDDMFDVVLSNRISPGSFTETWKISALTR